MKKYCVPTKFIFEGSFFISSDSKEEAIEDVKKHCRLTFGAIKSTLPDEDVSWSFDVHSQQEIAEEEVYKISESNITFEEGNNYLYETILQFLDEEDFEELNCSPEEDIIGESFLILKHEETITKISFILSGYDETDNAIYKCIYNDFFIN